MLLFIACEKSKVVAIPKGHGYVFAIEAKHCRGALGNLGEWSPPMFSRFIEPGTYKDMT